MVVVSLRSDGTYETSLCSVGEVEGVGEGAVMRVMRVGRGGEERRREVVSG